MAEVRQRELRGLERRQWLRAAVEGSQAPDAATRLEWETALACDRERLVFDAMAARRDEYMAQQGAVDWRAQLARIEEVDAALWSIQEQRRLQREAERQAARERYAAREQAAQAARMLAHGAGGLAATAEQLGRFGKLWRVFGSFCPATELDRSAWSFHSWRRQYLQRYESNGEQLAELVELAELAGLSAETEGG